MKYDYPSYIFCVIDIVLFTITVDPHYAMILVRRLRSRVSLSLGFTLFDRGADPCDL